MAHYQVLLRKIDGATVFNHSMACDDVAAAWPTIGEIARQADREAGEAILVRDERGQLVVLIGIASARVLAA